MFGDALGCIHGVGLAAVERYGYVDVVISAVLGLLMTYARSVGGESGVCDELVVAVGSGFD